jgi:hypothetical protein
MLNTLVYTDGGNNCHGTKELSKDAILEIKRREKSTGSKGYMVGHRYWNNEKERVIVFFREIPEDIQLEEFKRRRNGFMGAKWNLL